METLNQKMISWKQTIKFSLDNKIFKLDPYRINIQIGKQEIYALFSRKCFNYSILHLIDRSKISFL